MNDAAGPRHPTEPIDGWVEVDLPFPGVRQFEEEFAPNLATDGLFIPTPEPLPPSTVVRFHVTLPDEFVLLEGTGIVVWARPPGDASGAPAGMSLRFATLSQHYQDLLDRIVQTHVERGGTPFEVEPRLGEATGGVGDETAPSAAARGVASERPRLTVRRTGLPATVAVTGASDPPSVETFDPTGPLDETMSLEPRLDVDSRLEAGPPEPVGGGEEPTPDRQQTDGEIATGMSAAEGDPVSRDHWPPWEPSPELDLPTAASDPVHPEAGSRDREIGQAEFAASIPDRVSPDEVSREIPEELFSDDLDVETAGPEPEPGPEIDSPPPDDAPVTEMEAAPAARRRWSMGRTVGTAIAAVIVIGVVAVLVLSPWDGLVGGEGPKEGETTDVGDLGEVRDDGGSASGAQPAGDVTDADAEVAVMEREVPAAVPTVEPTPVVSPVPAAVRTPAGRIEEIRWSDDGSSTTLRIRGDGLLLPERVALIPMSGPPRLLIRIRYIETRYESYVIAVGSPQVSAIRTGLHPELSPPALYVVADLTGNDVVVTGRRFDGPLLEVTLGR
jgi:uncharacterized protein (TIGR02266 family)